MEVPVLHVQRIEFLAGQPLVENPDECLLLALMLLNTQILIVSFHVQAAPLSS